MTAPDYDKALQLLELADNPIQKLIGSSCYWIPLQFIYVAMVKNKDLTRVTELPESERLAIWAKIKQVNPQAGSWEKWKQKTMMQAVYVYQYLKN